MYRVLKPVYTKTGEVTYSTEGPMRWHTVEWQDIGRAEDLDDAKRKYGGYPVLEPEPTLH